MGTKIQKELGNSETPPTFKKRKLKTQSFSFKPENPKKIKKLIENIRKDVAPGIDRLNCQLIKDTKEEITPILTKIINTGYENNIFPDCLKMAVIKPI